MPRPQIKHGILWRRRIQHGKQKTVFIVPKTLRPKIIAVTHGDIMTGHECKNKTKERIISSYWWPGTNGTPLTRTKTAKHDYLVNTSLLVNYNKPMNTEETQKVDNQDLETEIPDPDI
jgi:hypothetical protein